MAIAKTEHRPFSELTKDTPYLALTDELCGVNTLGPRKNCWHFADNIFIFLNENVWILIKISLNFAPMVWINDIPALVQIMAWHQPGDEPLSEPMMVSLLMLICITRPQWVNCAYIGSNSSIILVSHCTIWLILFYLFSRMHNKWYSCHMSQTTCCWV